MQQYLDLIQYVIDNGRNKKDCARSVFGRQLRFDLATGFPLLTTRWVDWKLAVHRMFQFLLHWRCPNGYVIDQIEHVLKQIVVTPDSHYLVICSWDPASVEREKTILAPFDCLLQFYVEDDIYLSCQLYQRSADLFVEVPSNIASYALLTHMLAKQAGLKAGEFVHTFGDVYLYLEHLTDDIVYEQLKRMPRHLPHLYVTGSKSSLLDYRSNNFILSDYNPHPPIDHNTEGKARA